MKSGRNDPCPCGSGRKYKHCCLAAASAAPEAPEDLTWRRLRRLLDEYRHDMLRFTTNVYGRAAIEEAWHEFLLEDDARFDPESVHLQLFMPWLYHFWSPDSVESVVRNPSLHDVIPTAEYLRRKKSLNPLLREYLKSCLAAPLSVFEIREAEPGRRLQLHDTMTGEQLDVLERSASAAMQEGDVVFGQVARAGGIAMLEACQAFVIPPIWKLEAVNFRVCQFGGAITIPPERLRDYDLELLRLYHEIAARLFDRKLPALQNTDGEPLSMRRVLFDVPSAQEAFDALRHLAAGDSDDELLREAVRDGTGKLARVRFSWLKPGNAKNPSWENTVLGSIEIDGARLFIDVNSEKREETIRGIVAQALGDRARHRATEIQSMDQLLSRPPAPESEEHAKLAELPEVRAKIAGMMARHYEGWVNEKLPALGGRTPLEALADPAGREAVEALVRQIERDGERIAPPLDPAIVRRLRQRLGLG